MRTRRTAATLATVIVGAVALTGCGDLTSTGDSVQNSTIAVPGEPGAGMPIEDPAMGEPAVSELAEMDVAAESAPRASMDSQQPNPFADSAGDVQDREVVRTANMSLAVDDVTAVTTEFESIVTQAGGFVSQSRSEDYFGGTQSAYLTVRVPASELDTVMDRVSDLGRVETADTNSADVTAQSIDLAARIAATETSIARLNELLTQTGSLDELMRVEQELTYRQGTLDSLRGQQEALNDQVAMSTLTVTIRPIQDPQEPQNPEDAPIGFTAAFEEGWENFQDWMSRTVTDLGYAAPFLLAFAVPLLLVGAVIWLTVAALARRTRRARRATTPEPATPHTNPDPSSEQPHTPTG